MPDQVLGQVGGAIAGGLMGGDSETGGTSTVVQKADPWEGVQPALRTLYDAGLQNFLGGPQRYYPGQTVAPQSPVTGLAQQGIYNLATQQSPVLQGAQQQAYNTLGNEYLYSNPAMQDLYNLAGRDYLASSPAMWDLYGVGTGQMLGANPYIDDMFERAAGGVGRQFRSNVMPGIASMFSGAGRFGSNQMAEGLGQAEEQYGRTLQDLATSIYGGNYATERGYQQQALGQLGQFGLQGQALQQQALGEVGTQFGRERNLQAEMARLAPGLDVADYFGAQQLGQLGAQQDIYNQQLLNADIARFNFGQQQPYDQLSFLSSLLQGYPQGQTSTSTGTQTYPGNPLLGAMGGAQMGGALYNQLFGGGSSGWPGGGGGFGTGYNYGNMDYGLYF